MKDYFGRTINYLRVSVTERCNLRCEYCAPLTSCGAKQDILTTHDISAAVKAALDIGVNKVRLTGGEPLVRGDIADITADIAKDIRIKDFAITTNGVLLADAAKELKQAGLKRVNVSLDTLDAEKYSVLTRGGRLHDVLNGLDKARAAGLLPIKINAVLIGGVNDNDIKELARLVSDGIADELRFIELMPFGETASWPASRFVPNKRVVDELCLSPAKNTDPGSTATMYKTPSGSSIGLINPISHKFCGRCNRIRLTADGRLKPCLLTDAETDLLPCLHGQQDTKHLADAIACAIMNKPKSHALEEGVAPIKRGMQRIGG